MMPFEIKDTIFVVLVGLAALFVYHEVTLLAPFKFAHMNDMRSCHVHQSVLYVLL